AHRATVETLERRCAELEGEYGAASALASEAAAERDALAASLQAERQEHAAAHEAAAAAQAVAIAALERRCADLQSEFSTAEALASEVASERDELDTALEDGRTEAAGGSPTDVDGARDAETDGER